MTKTIATLLVAVTLATPVAASDHAWRVGNDSMHVYATDLDLNSASGRAAILARVERAAAKLCRDRADRMDCVIAAVRQAAGAPGATALQLAMAERGDVALAAR